MRDFNMFQTYGTGVTRRKDGSSTTSVVVAQTLDTLKEGVNGDKVHATPFRHIKVLASGTVQQLSDGWYDMSDDSGFRRVYYFQSVYNAPYIPSRSNLPYIGIGWEWYSYTMWVSTPERMRKIADNRCLENCKQSKFALGESLAELCETVSYATTKIAHFVRVLVDLKHGRFSNALKELGIRKSYMSKPMAERWLEAQFAIRPLIGEIEQARRLAYTQSLDAWHTINATGTAKEDYYQTDAESKTTAKLRLTTDAVWTISDIELRGLMQLGLANPVEILWEFLPFSWLVDYVVGVGDWISQLMAPMGCVHVTTSRSMKVKGVQEYAQDITTYQDSIRTRTRQVAKGVVEFEGLQRTPDYFAPVATLQYKLPLNVNQLATIAALTEIFTRGLR